MEKELSEKDQISLDDAELQEVKSKHWGAGDLVLSGVLIIYSILMIIGAANFPRRARMGRITSPAFTPIMLSIFVMALCVVLIIGTFKKYGKISISTWFKEVIADERMRRSYLLMVFILIYVLLVGRVHFLIANVVFLGIMYWYLKIGSWKSIIIYTLASSVFISLVVPYVFQMPLPFK
jgi:magnesium-transporting ATPase (P-type)